MAGSKIDEVTAHRPVGLMISGDQEISPQRVIIVIIVTLMNGMNGMQDG